MIITINGRVHKDLEKRQGEIGNQRKNRDNQDCSIVEIGLDY